MYYYMRPTVTKRGKGILELPDGTPAIEGEHYFTSEGETLSCVQ
jgi:hypothetical protein